MEQHRPSHSHSLPSQALSMEKQQPWGTPCHPKFCTGAIQASFSHGLMKMDMKCCCRALFEGAFNEGRRVLKHSKLSG